MTRLRTVTWNANGLSTKRLELLQLLRDLSVDIVFLQETWLRPDQIFSVPGYAVYRTDRPGAGRASGGTALLVARKVAHRSIPPNPALQIEATTIAVPYGNEELFLSSVYNSERRLQTADLDILLQPGSQSLVAGDLNAKHRDWGCRRTTTAGRDLRRYLAGRPHAAVIPPGEPTHYHNAGLRPDVLDLMICAHMAHPDCFVVNDLSSDHLPVVYDLPDDGALPQPPRPRQRVNWKRYTEYLVNHPRPLPPPPESTEDIDAQVQDITDLLQTALTASTTDVTPQQQEALPASLMREITLRRRLRRAWQHSRCPGAKADFNRQSRRVKDLLTEHRGATWDSFLEQQTFEDGTLWRLSKTLRGEKATIRPLHGQRGLVYSADDRAETFADTLEDQFSPHPDVLDLDFCDRVEDFVDTYDPEEDEDEEIPPVTPEEVSTTLASLHPKKAPGPDSIKTAALRNLPQWVMPLLASIFFACMRLAHFPPSWKVAKVIMIPKPGKNHLLPDSHRPISLLPVLSKVLERLILRRFPDDFHTSIRPEQFGFRRGHAADIQLRRVLSDITSATQRRLHTAAVITDVSKAFDRVWHEGLLFKLARSPLPGWIFSVLKSYLSDRSFFVSIGSAHSTTRPITAGVPQGSVLGPILYLWYTNDIPLAPRIQMSLYADDALFYTSSATPRQASIYLQRQLTLLQPWLQRWRIKVNADKSNAIVFTRKALPLNLLRLNGTDIQWQPKVKYLGVVLDRRLTLNSNVDRRIGLAQAALAGLRPLLRSTKLPTRTKLLLYTALVRPVLLWAAQSWYHLTSMTARRRLQAVQNKALRSITRSPWYVRNDVIRRSADVQTIRTLVAAATANMEERIATSTWDHIQRIGDVEVPQLRAVADDAAE